MTLAEMRRNIRYALGLNEPEELPIIDQKINDGVRDVLRRTGCTVLCFDATTPDYENRVTLAPGIIRVMHVTRNGVRLDRVSYEALRPGKFTQVGDVLIFNTAFSPDEKLQIWGVPGPSKLASPTDALEAPAFGGIKVEWQDAVQLYALAELAGLSNDETSNRGGNYKVQYEGQTGREGRLAEIRRQVNKMSGITLGKAQLEYRLVGLRQMKKTVKLFDEWRGMAPDNPRDRMSPNQVWRMEDLISRALGSSLESRQGWQYHVTTPLDGFVTAQIWANTLGGSHHLACTPNTLYNLDVPASPRVVAATPGALWPMSTLYEYVLVPRTGDQLPVVIRYAGATEVLVTTHGSTPKGKVAATWQSRFVLGNTLANANRLHFLSQEWVGGMTETPVWDPIAWWDTSADVTGLATTRNSLIIFHEGTVERLRGTKAPGAGVETDIWMEPLIGLGGCNEPHTICYWNDNVIFADARGVYLTDGTTIRDITSQGGVGREWRRAYDPAWRVAAGVVYDSYVIAMVDTTNKVFKKCFVADLYSRNWTVFNNMPFASFVASIGERERMYGGGLDGKVANLSTMWEEADPTIDTVDGNNVAVRPALETAWYRLGEDEGKRRVRNIYFSFDLAETNGTLKVYVCEQVQPRSPADWILVKTLQENDLIDVNDQPYTTNGYERRRIDVGRESYGFAFKLEIEGSIKNLKMYDLSAEVLPTREATYA